MDYLTLKALHLIFVVCWFAGLFYIVRLFIYHLEVVENKTRQEEKTQKKFIQQFQLMQRRLWYGITWPSAIFSTLFGFSLMFEFYWPLKDHPWLHYKLFFIFLLWGYHFYTHLIFSKLQKNETSSLKSSHMRIYNELATILLIVIIFTAIKKYTSFPFTLFLGLGVTIIFMTIAGILYKKKRTKPSQ